MKKIVLALLILAPLVTQAQTIVKASDLRKQGIIVTGYEIKVIPKVLCSNPRYASEDIEQLGNLGPTACFQKYDPCTPGSLAKAYDVWASSGAANCKPKPVCDPLKTSPNNGKGCQ